MIVIFWGEGRLNVQRTDHVTRFCSSGDVRAILTPPADVTIVKVFDGYYQREQMAPGDVYMGLAYPFEDRADPRNYVTNYSIYMEDSLEALALAAVLKPKARAVASLMTRHVGRYMRS
jgi:hypothetical protein